MLVIGGATAFASAAGLAWWLSVEQTAIAQAGVRRMIEGGVEAMERALSNTVNDTAQWTPAYEAARRGDAVWLADNIGTSTYDTGALDLAIVFDRESGAEWGWSVDGGPAPRAGLLEPEVRDTILSTLAAGRDAPDEGVGFYARSGGAVWLMAAQRLTLSTGSPEPDTRDRAPVMLMAFELSPERVAGVGEQFLIEDAHLVQPPAPNANAAALPGVDGAPVAYLSWTAPEPGLIALRRIAAPLGVAILLGVAALGYVGREIARTARRLETALGDAEAADKAKGAFLAAVSHELRTPLHGVIGMLQLLERSALGPQEAGFVAVARRAADLQLGMVEKLLDASRIEAGRVELSHGRFDALAACREATEPFAAQAAAKGVALALTPPPGAPAVWVTGDRKAFAQITAALVSNAVRFTAAGRISVRLSAEAADDRVDVTLEVEDTGPGVPPEDRERIFERFVQVGTVDTRAAGGAGLGLAIVKALVAMMNGSIAVAAAPGRGALFTVRLPFDGAASSAALRRAEATAEGGTARLDRKLSA